MKQLRIGLIGYGGIGRIHALAYRTLPYHYGLLAESVRIVGVATSHSQTAEAAAREIGCEVYTADYRELLARDDIHLIHCCTPNHTHEEIVSAAARAGKHVYCEKPLAMTVAEGARMVDAVRQANVKAQMTFNFRFFPAIMRARQLIEEGFPGRIFSFRGRYYRASYISAARPLSWRLRKDMAGGGALFDLGSHVMDLLYYLLGPFDSVQATLETLIAERPRRPGSDEKAPVDVDDIALIHARLSDGTLGLVEVSRMGTGTTNDLIIEVFGEQGALRFNVADPSWLEIYDARDPDRPLGGMRGFRRLETVQHYEGAVAPHWSMTPSFVRSHAECQYQFLRAIWEDTVPSPSLADGLHIQAIMEAAQRSSAEQRWATVGGI